jgi:hypothetical protein
VAPARDDELTHPKPTKHDAEPSPRAAAPSAPPKAPPAEADDDDNSGGIFGPIRLGPLVGVGLPNLLSLGGTLKLTRFLGGGVNIGIIPTVHLSYYGDATLSYQEYDVYGRIYPFGGGLFVGAGVGYEYVRGTLAGNVNLSPYQGLTGTVMGLLPPGYTLPDGYAVPASLAFQSAGSVRTLVLTPQLGYLYTFGWGFSIGIDIGAQIPIAPSQIKYESSVSPPEIAELQPVKDQKAQQDAKIRDTLETIGRAPLPTLNLRVGWLL